MWVTFPLLQEGLDTISAWGFKYKTIAFNWIKTNPKKGNLFWGMGNWTRSNSELCLLGVKGKPKRIDKGVHSVIMSPVQRHSKKPDEARTQIEALMGDCTKIELFARERVDGWTSLGYDIDGKDIRESLKELINGTSG